MEQETRRNWLKAWVEDQPIEDGPFTQAEDWRGHLLSPLPSPLTTKRIVIPDGNDSPDIFGLIHLELWLHSNIAGKKND